MTAHRRPRPCACGCGTVFRPHPYGAPRRWPRFIRFHYRPPEGFGTATRFRKGNVPVNKGTKGQMKANRTSFKKGQRPRNFKNWRAVSDGYVYVVPLRVRVEGTRYPSGAPVRVAQHRLVIESHIGRPLQRGEVVRHINGNRADNRLENLQLVNRAEHMALQKQGWPKGWRSAATKKAWQTRKARAREEASA